MDVKRIENVAIPTTLAAVGGGIAGYMLPKMAKYGQMTDEFLRYTSESMRAKDMLNLAKADFLDGITFIPSVKELEKINNSKNKNKRTKILALIKKASEKGNKQLRNFVINNAKVFGVKPKKGQTLKEAANEFINGKTVEEIKEAFLPASHRAIIENTDYAKLMKESFEDVYDSNLRTFKKDADKEMVEMFKRPFKEMKVLAAGKWAGIAGSVALVGTILADKTLNAIANRVANKLDR